MIEQPLKLSQIKLTEYELSQCTTLPYYDLWKVHNNILIPENFYSVVNSNLFDNNENIPNLRTLTNYLTKEIKNLEDNLKKLYNLGEKLPHQLIHGDLHHENVLCLIDEENKSGLITGVLDFEFIAWDWNVMELAICLSKFASENNPLIYFQAFIK